MRSFIFNNIKYEYNITLTLSTVAYLLSASIPHLLNNESFSVQKGKRRQLR